MIAPTTAQLQKSASAVSWAAIAGAIFIAVTNPPQGYELSIYSSTPDLYWILISIAGILGVYLMLSGPQTTPILAYCILPAAVLSVVSLPILRGYYFHGLEDPMTHLGWTIDVLSGDVPEDVMLYPALHHLAAVCSLVTGLPARISLLLLVVLMIGIWLICVPALVGRLVPGLSGRQSGVIAACFLLPLNPINVFARVHPTSQAIFLSPLVILFVYLVWIRSISSREGIVVISTLLVGLTLLHPLLSLGLAGLFGIAALVDPRLSGPRPRNSSIFWAASVGTFIFTSVSIYLNQRFVKAVSTTIAAIMIGSSGETANERQSSLAGLDVELTNFLLRLGGKYLLIIPFGLAGLLALYRKRSSSFLTHLVAAGIPFAMGLLAFLAAGEANIWGRFLGLLMVPATIVVGVGLAYLSSGERRWVRASTGTLVAATLAMAMITAFLGPFLLLPNHQVTESSAEGARTILEYDEDSEWMHVRFSINRYEHGIFGVENGPYSLRAEPHTDRIPDHFNHQSLSEFNESKRILLVGGVEDREVGLYNGFRYNRSDFAYLATSPDVNRIYSGGIDIYDTRPGGSAEWNRSTAGA